MTKAMWTVFVSNGRDDDEQLYSGTLSEIYDKLREEYQETSEYERIDHGKTRPWDQLPQLNPPANRSFASSRDCLFLFQGKLPLECKEEELKTSFLYLMFYDTELRYAIRSKICEQCDEYQIALNHPRAVIDRLIYLPEERKQGWTVFERYNEGDEFSFFDRLMHTNISFDEVKKLGSLSFEGKEPPLEKTYFCELLVENKDKKWYAVRTPLDKHPECFGFQLNSAFEN